MLTFTLRAYIVYAAQYVDSEHEIKVNFESNCQQHNEKYDQRFKIEETGQTYLRAFKFECKA